jgi:repressor LexA
MSTYRFTRANVEETSNMIYEYILNYIKDNGYPPAVRDICAGVGVRSTSTIHSHLKRLHEAGRIEYSSGKRRAIVIPEHQEEKPVFLPLVGQITAGIPIFAEENIERNLPFPADFFSDDAEVFALQVKGDSMVGAAILDKDYVIVRKQNTARSGDIIAALVGDEATVKTLANVDGQMILQPQNPAYSPIPFNTADCQVLGIVCAVFRVGS